VKYPYSTEPRQSIQGSQGNYDSNAIDLNSIIEKLPAEAEYSSFEEKQEFNKDLNSLDIAIENNYTASNELFEFSIKIPKDKITSNTTTDFSKLSIGVVTNKREDNVNKERGQGQNQGMRSGGGRGNGAGRGGAGRQNGQRPSAPTEKAVIDFGLMPNKHISIIKV